MGNIRIGFLKTDTRDRMITTYFQPIVEADGISIWGSEQQFELMRELGVELFQGYLFGKPSPEPLMEAALMV